MKMKIQVQTLHPETGARLASHTRMIDESKLRETIDELLYSTNDHYTDTPAERRPVVEFRLEYV